MAAMILLSSSSTPSGQNRHVIPDGKQISKACNCCGEGVIRKAELISKLQCPLNEDDVSNCSGIPGDDIAMDGIENMCSFSDPMQAVNRHKLREASTANEVAELEVGLVTLLTDVVSSCTFILIEGEELKAGVDEQEAAAEAGGI